MYALASPYSSLAIFESVSPDLTSRYFDSSPPPLATVSRSLTFATDDDVAAAQDDLLLGRLVGGDAAHGHGLRRPVVLDVEALGLQALRGDVALDRLAGGGVQRRDVGRRWRAAGRGRRLGTVEQLFAGFLDETDEAHDGAFGWWGRTGTRGAGVSRRPPCPRSSRASARPCGRRVARRGRRDPSTRHGTSGRACSLPRGHGARHIRRAP